MKRLLVLGMLLMGLSVSSYSDVVIGSELLNIKGINQEVDVVYINANSSYVDDNESKVDYSNFDTNI